MRLARREQWNLDLADRGHGAARTGTGGGGQTGRGRPGGDGGEKRHAGGEGNRCHPTRDHDSAHETSLPGEVTVTEARCRAPIMGHVYYLRRVETWARPGASTRVQMRDRAAGAEFNLAPGTRTRTLNVVVNRTPVPVRTCEASAGNLQAHPWCVRSGRTERQGPRGSPATRLGHLVCKHQAERKRACLED